MNEARIESLQDIVRRRGFLLPVSVSQDLATLAGATLLTAIAYLSLTRTRPTSVKDKVLLASGSAVFWYGGRYVLFGTRWGVTSAIWMTDTTRPITPSNQWMPCPYEDQAQCDFYSVPVAQGHQAANNTLLAHTAPLHFGPVLHYVKAFVEHQPLMLVIHLWCIMVAGFLWPLQVRGPFRQENYKRHKLIGKIVMTTMFGSHVTAAVISYQHLLSESWAERVTGLGFSANIAASVYSLLAAALAAKRKDIAQHKRHVIRMLGLAYGVFPTKYIWVYILAMGDLVTGTWVYAIAIWLSAVTGVLVTEWAFLGKLAHADKAHDRQASEDEFVKSL